jgi:hypothetical protein
MSAAKGLPSGAEGVPSDTGWLSSITRSWRGNARLICRHSAAKPPSSRASKSRASSGPL